MDGVSQNAGINSVNDGLALAALVAGKDTGSYDIPWKSVVGGGISDLREAVKDAECSVRSDVQSVKSDVRESIQNLSIQNTQQFAHVHEKACDAEKEAIKAQYEGKLQTIQTGKEVENRVSDAERLLSQQGVGFERNVDNRFCDLAKDLIRESAENRRVTVEQSAITRELVRSEACSIREKQAECCCELKEAIAGLSKEHVSQLLAATKDELQEARFEAILAKVATGNGK